MRFGMAIDLHATSAARQDVAWPQVRELALRAESDGLDLVVLPDHLAYRAGGEGDYATDDEPVGARESFTVAAALAAVTSTLGIAHSVVNAPYRTPSMLAHLASTVADVANGRYSLGIGVGNSFDYEQLGVAADHRVARFEECIEIVSSLLRTGHVDFAGRYWSASQAELVLAPDLEHAPMIVVAAGGPRTMLAAVTYGDAWNGWCPTDPEAAVARELVGMLDQACERLGRDPAALGRTVDLTVDPLDHAGGRARSLEALGQLRDLGIDEARCYPVSPEAQTAKLEAASALAAFVREV